MTETSSAVSTFELSKLNKWWLQRRAMQSAPEEACGFILDDQTIIEINNSDPYPYKGFQMSGPDIAKKLTAEQIPRIRAIWHTHPGGSTTPSALDQKALKVGAIQPNWAYFIVTKNEITRWDTSEVNWNDFRT